MTAWQKFKQAKTAYYSFLLLIIIFVFSLGAECLSHDRPWFFKYQNDWYFPIMKNYPETTFGGQFYTPTDYKDPWMQHILHTQASYVVFPPNPFHHDTLDYLNPESAPAAPSKYHLLGTDDHGRDVLARLIYSVRISLVFALILAVINTFIGVVMGALQGYIGGKFDLYTQRFLEIWGGFPELYLWIILASLFTPSIGLLLFLLCLSSWIGIADYMRVEFLKTRQMDYVKSAKIMGIPPVTIMRRHILPNVMVPMITMFPFRVSGGILALTALDFLGFGLPSDIPTLGELLSQSKNNLDAWWLMSATIGAITLLGLCLTFIGDGLRQAFALNQNKF